MLVHQFKEGGVGVVSKKIGRNGPRRWVVTRIIRFFILPWRILVFFFFLLPQYFRKTSTLITTPRVPVLNALLDCLTDRADVTEHSNLKGENFDTPNVSEKVDFEKLPEKIGPQNSPLKFPSTKSIVSIYSVNNSESELTSGRLQIPFAPPKFRTRAQRRHMSGERTVCWNG
jgi:hypothetical protein